MEKKNNFMLVMIVILSISLLGAVSFIVYDKVIKKDEGTNTATKTTNNDQTNNSSDTTDKTSDNVDNSQTTSENNSKYEYNYKLSNRNDIQIFGYSGCSYFVKVYSDKKGDVYLTIYPRTSTSICESSASEKTNVNKLISKMTENKVSGLGRYMVDANSEDYSINSIKLNVSNVLTMYEANSGQYENGYIFFVKEGGKISYLRLNDIFEKGEVVVKDIDEIDNVVSIANVYYTDGDHSYAITLDGKEINLTNYLDEYKR